MGFQPWQDEVGGFALSNGVSCRSSFVYYMHARKQLYKLARTIDSWGNRIDSPGSGEMRVAKENAPTVLDRNAQVSSEFLSIHENWGG